MLQWLLVLSDLTLSAIAAAHVLLNKRDPRAVTGWIAVCFLTPFVGAMLYFLFGVNRVRTRARRLASNSPLAVASADENADLTVPEVQLSESVARLAVIAETVTGRSLVPGNHVEILFNGEQAFPAMLNAIGQARVSVFLSTYIFDVKHTGQQFINALAAATQRGVDVRVIIDGYGEMTGDILRFASRRLRKKGVRVERFIPPRLIPPAIYVNLRNHRKILLVDSSVAFTGGMNISHRHYADNKLNKHRVSDIHFCLTGPVVNQIEQAFLEDWGFVSNETQILPTSQLQQTGSALCRVIVDGPNEYLFQLERVLVAVIAAAKQRVAIMTPYFLPSNDLMTALRSAAVRGVDVEIILPDKIDHRALKWAACNILDLVILDGAKVYYQPEPFCHSKLLLVDDDYVMIGSANLDPRSLRLNFELVVEVFAQPLAASLWQHFETVKINSKLVTIAELEARSLAVKLRDAAAWACSPYL